MHNLFNYQFKINFCNSNDELTKILIQLILQYNSKEPLVF